MATAFLAHRALLSGGVVLLPFLPAPTLAQGVDATAAAIERRLYPSVTLGGTPDSGWSLRERMRHHGVAGVSITLVADGRVAWSGAYGVRDRATGAPVTPATLFQAGSLSKPVAAATALRLVEGGVLTLDDDINRWLRGWRVPVDSFTQRQPVTLRLLLSHRAGMTVSGYDGYARGTPQPTLTQVLDGIAPANSAPVRVERVPGSAGSYSGGGYVVAQQALTDATGRHFEALAQQQVFGPLGMTRSTYASIADTSYGGNVARGYQAKGEMVPGGWMELPEQAPASLWTTAEDYARFMVGLQRAYRDSGGRWMRQGTAREMMRLQGPAGSEQGIGVGLKGEPPYRFSHTGWNTGFRSLMIGYLDRGEGIVVMTNADDGDGLAMEIARAAAKARGWADIAPAIVDTVPVDAVTRAALVGRYELGAGWQVEVSQRDGALMAGPAGRRPMPIFARAADDFFFTFDAGVSFTVLRGPDGGIRGIRWRQGDRVTEGRRVAP